MQLWKRCSCESGSQVVSQPYDIAQARKHVSGTLSQGCDISYAPLGHLHLLHRCPLPFHNDLVKLLTCACKDICACVEARA